MPTFHIIVKGKVQGVFYRASAKQKARELALGGWIKNTVEGNVEVMVTGEQQKIESFIQWCHKGPEEAIVTHVEVLQAPDQSFDSFNVLR